MREARISATGQIFEPRSWNFCLLKGGDEEELYTHMRKNGLVIGRCPKTDHEDVRRLRDGRTDGKIGHVMNRELKAVGWAGPKKYWRLFL